MILIFDLSGVFFNDGLKAAIKNISKAYHLQPSEIERVLNGHFAADYRLGNIEPDEFLGKCTRDSGCAQPAVPDRKIYVPCKPFGQQRLICGPGLSPGCLIFILLLLNVSSSGFVGNIPV